MSEDQRAYWRKAIDAKRREREQLFQEAYGARGVAVLATLIRHDPAGLIGAGAPSVQYAIEAAPICDRLSSSARPGDIRDAIHQVFEAYFGVGITDRAVEELMANEIWSAWSDD